MRKRERENERERVCVCVCMCMCVCACARACVCCCCCCFAAQVFFFLSFWSIFLGVVSIANNYIARIFFDRAKVIIPVHHHNPASTNLTK